MWDCIVKGGLENTEAALGWGWGWGGTAPGGAGGGGNDSGAGACIRLLGLP